MTEATRQIILLASWSTLWVARRDEVQERKRAEYQQLVEDCHKNEWRTRCMPVEVKLGIQVPQRGLQDRGHYRSEQEDSHQQQHGGGNESV